VQQLVLLFKILVFGKLLAISGCLPFAAFPAACASLLCRALGHVRAAKFLDDQADVIRETKN